jgi:hypothetical protein
MLATGAEEVRTSFVNISLRQKQQAYKPSTVTKHDQMNEASASTKAV